MMRRHVIGIASAVALLAASACDSGDSNGDDERDSAAQQDDAGRTDAGGDAGGGGNDGSVEAGTGGDAGTSLDGGGGDAGTSNDASTSNDAGDDIDASPDASSVNDAQIQDAQADAADPELDATTGDAAADDGAVADAADNDAAQGDAAADSAVGDASVPLPLRAHYTFDENTGTVVADSTETLAAGMLVNGATWTTGRFGSAVDLAGGAGTGANPHVVLPSNLLENCEEATVALWMKLGSLPPWARLIDIDGLSNGFLYFTPTQMISGTPHLMFNIWHPDGNDATADDQRVSAAYPEGTQLVDEWHHVAFTMSGGIGRLYFDGEEIGSNAMLWTPATLNYLPGGRTWLGRSLFVADAYLDASIDDLRVACTAYSAEDIAALAE